MYFQSIIQLFFPVSCRLCNTKGSALCETCAYTLPEGNSDISGVVALFSYDHPLVSEGIKALKYGRKSELARAIASEGARRIASNIEEIIHSPTIEEIALVPIPLHSRKLRMRGFNQSLILAQWIQRGIPQAKVKEVLSKVVFHAPQVSQSKDSRLENVQGSMCAKTCSPNTLYIVIDDVTTTGATFKEGVRALQEAGATRVWCIALAHGT